MELQLPIEIYPESEFRVTKILRYAGRVDAYHFELDGHKYFVHEEFHHKPHIHMISVGRKDVDGSYDRDKYPHIQVDEFIRLEFPYGQPLSFRQTRTAVLSAFEKMGVVKFCDSPEQPEHSDDKVDIRLLELHRQSQAKLRAAAHERHKLEQEIYRLSDDIRRGQQEYEELMQQHQSLLDEVEHEKEVMRGRKEREDELMEVIQKQAEQVEALLSALQK